VDHTDLLSFPISTFVAIKQSSNNLTTNKAYENCSILFGIRHSMPIFLINFNIDIDTSVVDVNTDVSISVTITLVLGKNVIYE